MHEVQRLRFHKRFQAIVQAVTGNRHADVTSRTRSPSTHERWANGPPRSRMLSTWTRSRVRRPKSLCVCRICAMPASLPSRVDLGGEERGGRVSPVPSALDRTRRRPPRFGARCRRRGPRARPERSHHGRYGPPCLRAGFQGRASWIPARLRAGSHRWLVWLEWAASPARAGSPARESRRVGTAGRRGSAAASGSRVESSRSSLP